ncbi:MAG: hypothetical protein HQM15_11930 [Deltaproteobacteria bacterium]|nr:hypothetical protein [Deltaproteobacteria bacterium]
MNSELNVCKLELFLAPNPQRISLHFFWPHKIEELQELPITNDEINIESLYFWMLSHCRKIFELEELPQDIQLTIGAKFNKIPEIIQVCQKIMSILASTSNKIRGNLFLKEEFKSFEGKLFYNIEDLFALNDLYLKIKEKHSDQTHCLNMKSGWNKLKRCWEETDHYSIRQLLDMIREKKIKTIFSVNMFLPNDILKKEDTLLIPLLKHLGIEFIIIDFDTYELVNNGHTKKAVMNMKEVRRFSIYPSISKYFDQAAGANEIRYFSYGDILNPDQLIHAPDPNPEIVFLSNARSNYVLGLMPQILHFMNYVDSENPFDDQQMLFYAINHLLLHSTELEIDQKWKYYSLFADVYMGVLSLLKYEVISGIETTHKVLLFGDTAWEKLFPQYYQNRFLNEEEQKEKLQNGKSIYILFNQNYSYFENNPVFLRAINYAAPYLTFPAAATLQELSGLRHLEYSNPQEFNSKLKNIGSLCKDPEYQSSLQKIKSYLKSCHNDFVNQVENPEIKISLYDQLCNENEQIFQQKLEGYIKNNFYRISQCMDELMKKNPKEFQLNQYSYFHKSYTQNLLTHFGQKHS